jgi:hypothetical protein
VINSEQDAVRVEVDRTIPQEPHKAATADMYFALKAIEQWLAGPALDKETIARFRGIALSALRKADGMA